MLFLRDLSQRGRVYGICNNFTEVLEGMAWFRSQEAKWAEATLQGRWIRILCADGRVAIYPEAAVELCAPMKMNHTLAPRYFRDCD